MKDNKTVWAILGLLSHEGMSGYDIKKRIENTIGFFWNAGYGQIYPTLAQLESKGLVSRAPAPGGKGPRRILYAITAQGLSELKRWLELPAEKEDVKFEILLKLIFGRLSPTEKNAAIIGEFKERNERNLALMHEYKASLSGVLGKDEDHLYYYLAVLFGEKVYSAYLE